MTPQHTTIVSWNVNGIRAAEKKGFLDWLQNARADVVAVQETRASVAQVSAALREPHGFHASWCAAEKKGYSGVATFSRMPPLAVTCSLGDPRFDSAGRVLVSDFSDWTLFNIYFPNGGRGPELVEHKLAFYARFLEVVSALIAAGRRVVVAGDVNTAYAEIDLARPRANTKTSGFMPEERAALGQFFAAGLIDTFRHVRPTEVKYTWWYVGSGARARNVGWRLDYIFVSPNLRDAIVDADIHTDVFGSDHCPVSVTLRM
ncbi:MAG TPA: exodeoxyribonuclease III [Roseiflexaceae bacterium]|nr:exodeoxyribonuclease III [Roseiflexaceae bacterium]